MICNIYMIDCIDDSDTKSLQLFSQLTVQFYDRSSIINPCLDSSVRFVEKLVHEVKQMHASANIPLESYHFGGVSEVSHS